MTPDDVLYVPIRLHGNRYKCGKCDCLIILEGDEERIQAIKEYYEALIQEIIKVNNAESS